MVNKITSHPPIKKSMRDFILEAENKTPLGLIENNKENLPQLPWVASHIRADVQKIFALKLSEEYLLKIKYISECTNKSQQKIIREIVCKEIDNLLKEMGI